MTLTGSLFLWTLSLAAVGMFVWSVVAWPKAAGPGWWAVSRRIGRQLAVVVLAIAAVAAVLNHEYGWYSNWADLGASFSSTPPPAEIQQAGAPPSVAAAGHLGSSRPDAVVAGTTRIDTAAALGLKAKPGPNGQYRTFQVPGPISGHSGAVTIWFPADYASPAQAFHRFPVVEAFHGVPGSPAQLAGQFVDIGAVLAKQVSAGQLREAIIVLPDYTPHQVDTECVNGTNAEPRMEDWLTKDVPEWVDSHVRVDRDRGSFVTLGFSAGGWCSAMAAMLHPETYAACVVLQGYFQPTFERPYIPFRSNSPEGERYDLVRLAHQDPPRTALWILTSKADPLSYGTTKQLLADARTPLSITAVVLKNGGHRTSVWLPFLQKSLQWLGSNVTGFAPLG